MARWLLAAGLVAALAAVYFSTRGDDAYAAGPCSTSHAALDSEEQQFLSALQQWRASGVSNEPVEVSGALNQAAAWFAEWQVTNNALGGHNDSFGRTWVQRAIDCGYTAKLTNGQYWASGSGEGVYASATGGTTVGAQQALQGMLAQGAGHSGIYMTGSPPSFPAKCYGVGVYRNGTKVAWVVVIAQLPYNLACPGGSGGGTVPPPTTPAGGTTTPTASPSPTATATPTQKPVFFSWFSQLARD